MKRIITLFVFLTTTLFYAQNSGITYQAVLYNPSGEILPGNNNSNAVLSNKDICLRFSIKDATTNLEYQETQKVKTDEFGMVNLVVGKGNQVGGYASNFDAIVWNSSNKKLQVEIDVTGNCSSFIEISDQDFSAVPFAYASKTAENVSGIVAIANGGTGASTVVGAKTNLGLNNVDNTSDANKPISTATQAALDTKAPLASPALTGTPTVPTATIGTNTTQIASTAFVNSAIAAATTPDATETVKGKIKLTGDLGGTADSPTVPGLANKENTIAAGTTAQYYRGDKSWQTLDKTAVGLGNVSNTTDADKPVSTATQTALDAKEAAANKSANPALGTSDDLFPTQKAVKTYVDNQISAGVVDASTSTKGKIQLAGDLGGTADAPIISNNAVTTTKIANNAVTNAKLGEIVSVNKGGTGADMSNAGSGYIKQATSGANFTTVAKIPVADVDGAVRKVNGVQPDANGNVAVIIGRVFTGSTVDPDDATSIINANPAKQQSDIYVVASTGNPDNGRTFIYDGTNWLEVATDLSTTDARYVNEDGDIMEGDLTFPTGTKIIIDDAPTASTHAVNRAYVDDLIASSATPDATDLIKGKIKLTNHLGGTADAPTVPGLALKAPLESPSFTGTPLAPTAAAGTNTTQIATTAFVTAATSGMQDAITLTTTGTGAASFDGSTLNIPTPNNGTVTEVSDLTIGTSGTDITSTVATATTTPVITLNVPTASATNRGALSAADWTTFNNKVGGSGTTNFIPKFTATSTLGNSSIFDNGTNVGIGTSSPTSTLHIENSLLATNTVNANAKVLSLSRPPTTDIKWNNVANFNLGSYAVVPNGGNDAAHTRLDLTLNDVNISSFTNVMTWLANGNVGIGTTSPISRFSNAPSGTNFVGSTNATQSSNGISWLTNSTGYNTSLYNAGTEAGSNGLQVKVANTSPQTIAFEVGQNANLNGTSTSLFNVLGNGNVGIGTNSPSTDLDVVGGFSLRNAVGTAGSNYGIEISTSSFAPRIDWVFNGNYVGQFDSNANDFRYKNSRIGIGGHQFITNSGSGEISRLTILNNGNVGIGTTSPAAQLHTTGTVRFAGAGTPGSGKVLTSDASGNATWQSTSVNRQTANYTLTANDSNGVVIMDSNDPVTVTVPATLTAGFFCQIIQKGTGQVTVVVASGVTINSANGTKTRARYSSIGVLMESVTEGYISGDSEF